MCYERLDRYKRDNGKDFVPFPPPETSEDIKQKVEQLQPFERFIMGILDAREFPFIDQFDNFNGTKEYEDQCWISCKFLLEIS